MSHSLVQMWKCLHLNLHCIQRLADIYQGHATYTKEDCRNHVYSISISFHFLPRDPAAKSIAPILKAFALGTVVRTTTSCWWFILLHFVTLTIISNNLEHYCCPCAENKKFPWHFKSPQNKKTEEVTTWMNDAIPHVMMLWCRTAIINKWCSATEILRRY